MIKLDFKATAPGNGAFSGKYGSRIVINAEFPAMETAEFISALQECVDAHIKLNKDELTEDANK